MPDFEERESQDLGEYGALDASDTEDYEVLDPEDTLEGDPGDDPLDTGIIPPDHWSAGLRRAAAGDEDSESLDELLSEEEPDVQPDPDDSWDENATDQDVTRYERDEDADPRAGRLVATDEEAYDDGDTSLRLEDELVARDAGIDGGAATAEEAAVHVVDEDDLAGCGRAAGST
jgi:Family of unknown function (DUF5709)